MKQSSLFVLISCMTLLSSCQSQDTKPKAPQTEESETTKDTASSEWTRDAEERLAPLNNPSMDDSIKDTKKVLTTSWRNNWKDSQDNQD